MHLGTMYYLDSNAEYLCIVSFKVFPICLTGQHVPSENDASSPWVIVLLIGLLPSWVLVLKASEFKGISKNHKASLVVLNKQLVGGIEKSCKTNKKKSSKMQKQLLLWTAF